VTEENRGQNARDELEKAEECLAEAKTLHAAGFPSGTTSRAYFAVFHAARALLYTLGLEPRSQAGTIELLGQHFVLTGRFPSSLGRLVSHMQKDREDSDYVTSAVFTAMEGEEAVRNADHFLEVARGLVDESAAP
jgi:uncharacterized protein (UPF0332 family)